MMDNLDREELRQTVLEVLVARHPGEPSADQLRANRAVKTLDFAIEPADMESALTYLQNLGLVEARVEALGSTAYWKATAAGIQMIERKPKSPKRD